MHVDGAEFYSNSEYICWNISSALSTDHVYDTRFPMVVIPHESMRSEATKQHVHQVIAQVVAWSLESAASGVYPTTGPFGEQLIGRRSDLKGAPLANGWRGVYYGFRADEKARKETHCFFRSYQHSLICMNCLAQKPHKGWHPELSYKDMTKDAGHRLSRISHSTRLIDTFFC